MKSCPNRWDNALGRYVLPFTAGRGDFDYHGAIFYNVLQLTEVGDYEAQNLNLETMLNRSKNAHITTEPPILVRCCYMLCFTNLK